MNAVFASLETGRIITLKKKTDPRVAARRSSAIAKAHNGILQRRGSSATPPGSSFLRAAIAAFCFGCVGVIGLDALSNVVTHPFPEARVTPSLPAQTLTWLIDANGDGIADFANPVEGALRGVDYYGSGAYGSLRDGGKRKHEGVDYVAAPGHTVTAPIAGVITRIGYAYKKDSSLRYVEIFNAQSGFSARVLYVAPDVDVGQTVGAGDAIGVAQDLSEKYPGGITNHVHVEVRDPRGVTLDASTFLPGAAVLQAAATPVPLPHPDPA